MTKYNKQQAISIIIDCAAKYEENLNGYQLLFILKDKHKHISRAFQVLCKQKN